jgi:hypothetical protein
LAALRRRICEDGKSPEGEEVKEGEGAGEGAEKVPGELFFSSNYSSIRNIFGK